MKVVSQTMKLSLFSVRLLALSLGYFATQPMIYGAEISHVLMDEVVFEGQIEPGDCLKFRNFMSKQGAHRIYLASPGGNLREAMEIGRLVRALKLETIVPGKWTTDDINRKWAEARNLKAYKHNYMCASACFFIFAAGISREFDGDDPILGIHRPYLSEDDLRKLNYDQALRAGRETKTTVEAYLREMSVPSKYSDRLFSISPGAIQWISTDEFEADFHGIIPELKDWVSAQGKAKLQEVLDDRKDIERDIGMPHATSNKAFLDAYIKRLSEPVTRDAEILNSLANDAWSRMFDVLRVIEPPEKARSFCSGSN